MKIKKKNKISVFSTVNYLLFTIISVIMLYPFWYILMYSFSNPNEVSLNNYYLIPHGFTFETYKLAFRTSSIYTGFLNSVIVTVAGTLIGLALTTMTAYPLSRQYLKGRSYIFGFVMFTMLFHGGIIPTYLIVRSYGMVDTLWALFLPSAVNVYNMLIMIKFFKNIPDELIESARIDGCNEMKILARIIIPLSTAVLATIGLFYAVFYWNSFLPGLIYLNDNKKWPLQVVLRSMLDVQASSGAGGDAIFVSPENLKMATVVITVTPILMLYPYLQKYFTKGVMIGSVKG